VDAPEEDEAESED
jgi:hypothetical protein